MAMSTFRCYVFGAPISVLSSRLWAYLRRFMADAIE